MSLWYLAILQMQIANYKPHSYHFCGLEAFKDQRKAYYLRTATCIMLNPQSEYRF